MACSASGAEKRESHMSGSLKGSVGDLSWSSKVGTKNCPKPFQIMKHGNDFILDMLGVQGTVR